MELDTARPQPPKAAAHGAGHFLHHLRAALAIGSIVTLLHGVGGLGWLDNLMLKLVGGSGPVLGIDSKSPSDLPVVVLIGAELYETQFGQASPLSLAKLAQLIRVVGSESIKPAALVIDLDLSPSQLEPLGDPGRVALNGALRQLVEAGTVVVLPLPLRVATAELQKKKFEWLRTLCAWNGAGTKGRIEFGIAEILTNQGVVTQLEVGQPTIGAVAAERGEAGAICKLAQVPRGQWSAPLIATAFNNRAIVPSDSAYSRRPFNAQFFMAGGRHIFVLDALDRLPTEIGTLGGKAVFLGGAYSSQDLFVVPFEGPHRMLEGVVIHAATFYSLLHPVGSVEGLSAFVLDVVLGIGMGFVFAATWAWHLRSVAAANVAITLTAQLAPRLTLALNVIFAIMLAAGSMFLAGALLFPLNIWVSPGPIILGVFAKFLLASRSQHSGDHGAIEARQASSLLRLFDIGLLSLLVVSAITLVLLYH